MSSSAAVRTAPGPSGWDVLPMLLALRADPLRAFADARARWGDVVRFPLGKRTFFVASHPEHARHVLRDRARNYTKDTWTYGLIRSIVGAGVLTTDGAEWKRQRAIVQPAFHRALMEDLASIVLERTDRMIDDWLRRARDEVDRTATVDLGAETTRLALDVVSRAVLGIELCDEHDTIARRFTALLEHLQRRLESPIGLLTSRSLSAQRAFREDLAALDQVVWRIIASRRERGGSGSDLVALLLEARTPEGAPLPDREIVDQVRTFLLAGHETSSTLLTWTLSLLARSDAARDALSREVSALDGARPCAAHVPRLPFAGCVIKEALRMYPPIWLIERRATDADELGGFDIPAGASIAISTHAIHRHPQLWDAPDEFRPERFAREVPDGLAFMPFGAGARICIGEAFAMMEAQLAVARLTQRVHMWADDGEPLPAARPYVTLRPATRARVRVRAAASDDFTSSVPRTAESRSCSSAI